MNLRLIVFSGVVTAVIGSGLGLVLANMFPTPYTSSFYQNLDRKYAAAGAVAGLLFGSSQEALRQLKKQREQEEL